MKLLRALNCRAALVAWGLVASGLSGCQWFAQCVGIDTRPGIEWLTVNERRPVKEPMYQRTIPEVGLVKRWPAKLGVNYGYAPWEQKTDATVVSQDGSVAAVAPGAQPGAPMAGNKMPSSGVRMASADDAMPGRNQQAVYNAPVVASDNSSGVEHADWTSRGPVTPGSVRPKTPAKKPSMPPAPGAMGGAPSNIPGGDAEVQPRSVRSRAPQLLSTPQARSIEAGDETTPAQTSQLPDVFDSSDALPIPETTGGAGPPSSRSAPASEPSPELTEISDQFGVGGSSGGRSH